MLVKFFCLVIAAPCSHYMFKFVII